MLGEGFTSEADSQMLKTITNCLTSCPQAYAIPSTCFGYDLMELPINALTAPLSNTICRRRCSGLHLILPSVPLCNRITLSAVRSVYPRWTFRYILKFLRDGMLPTDRALLTQVSRRPFEVCLTDQSHVVFQTKILRTVQEIRALGGCRYCPY